MARSKSTSSGRSGKERTPAPPPPTWDETLINSLLPWRLEITGLALLLLGAITLLDLLGLASLSWFSWWARLLRQFTGWGAYPLCLSLIIASLHLALRRVDQPYHVQPTQLIGFELILLAALPLSHQLSGATLSTAYLGQGGGLIGWALAEPLLDYLGPLLTGFLHLSLLFWGAALLLRVGWHDVIHWLRHTSVRLQQWARQIEPAPRRRPTPADAPVITAGTPKVSSQPAAQPSAASATAPDEELLIIDDSAPESPARKRRRSARLPPMTVLETGTIIHLSKEEIDEKKRVIEQCLLDFGLPAVVTEIRRGPAVTQFGVQPGYMERPGPDGLPKQQKVRVSQIAALQRDLALALAAPRLRIEAPVPGRGIVGVEVPNAQISVVRLRTIIESEPFYKLKSPLALALGLDVSGSPVATDLGRLPHLLIAGTTGSGKSICINSLVTCLVFNNTPEQLKLVMIDPKKVELIRFNGLPHLIGRVEVEGERVIGVMRWLTAEMDRRYQLFTSVGARHLADYNRKIARDKKAQKLPYVAVFIDELADLMATFPGDIERTLCRLAQMARATGIHLVVATQRPSTDVITGLIKANFPARASFAVASGTDSRVILDTVGAEHLLGKGDMLFLPPDASAPLRIQGCFVADLEVEAVVEHWQKTVPDFEPAEPPWESLIARQTVIEETDEMLEEAIALAQKYETISTSLLQRRLRTGYPRAARLMEILYEMGMVSDPKTGGRTRRTLVDEDDEDPLDDYLSGQDPFAK